MENVLLLLQLNVKRNLKILHQPVLREEIYDFYDAISPNAYYDPLFNEISMWFCLIRFCMNQIFL